MPPSRHSPARYVAMKDSWIHADDRRERGRVDRGVTRPRRSPSPIARRPESDRDSKPARERSPGKSRPLSQHTERARDRSHDRRRRVSRSPVRDSREEVRERNRGRELLDTRGSDKPRRSGTHRSPSSIKRRKSRSPSPPRSHHKKSRRGTSRSPSRFEGGSSVSSRPEKRRHELSPLPTRRRSPERRSIDTRGPERPRHTRESSIFDKRGRSRSPRRIRQESPRGGGPPPRSYDKRDRSRPRISPKPRQRSPIDRAPAPEREREREHHRKREPSETRSRRNLDIDRYEPSSTRSRPQSPRPPRNTRDSRGSSPSRTREPRPPRDEYRPGNPPKPKSFRADSPGASGANSTETNALRASKEAKSGPNSGEAKSEKMAGRGYYGQPGYNPNQQMQAAFPLKPQYNQGPPPLDPRRYSQSPQHHMTPGSYQNSPVQSPYSSGRGGWGGQQPPPQQQYSPQPQYPQSYQQPPQPNYAPPAGPPQGNYYNQSPPYPASGSMNQPYQQQPYRGNRGNYRGNNFIPRGGRGEYRGRGGHFQNLHWNNNGGPGGAGRGQYNNSGNAPPQQHYQQPPQSQSYPPAQQQQQQTSPHHSLPLQPHGSSGSHEGTPKHIEPQIEEEDDDLFRPSKELQIEDKDADKAKDEEKMPPPSRPTPTGPHNSQNSSKFSFAFKGQSKAIAPPKPEISQKLNAAPTRNIQVSPDRPRGPNTRNIPTEPASIRRQDFRTEPPPPTTRKYKKIMRRQKERPQLPDEFKKSDSVYYRKPGNESVVGSGTYGKVFKGVHVYTKSLVALKKIRMEGERDGFPVTAVREIKLLQSLKHVNIVNLEEVMVEKNDCYMVFEYLSHDLTGLLNHPTFKLEPAHKKHLAKQLFEGLDYLHRRGVLHRDIKAANILVSSDGQLKLADFGLARFYAKRRQLDYTNRVITIWYRSPELLLGETQYGPAVDIWSAACVLVEIFTRHAIFPGDGGEISQLDKIYAVLGTPNRVDWPGLTDMAWFELLRPTVRRPNVFADKYKERLSPAAYELLEAMFQYDPAKRPSASDVLEHPYFTVEEPKPRQAVELAKLDGEWHEFESKALRKENERKDKEARRVAQKEAAMRAEKEKKRGPEVELLGDAKRGKIEEGKAVPAVK